MGRPSKSRVLGLWANGVRVGQWVLPAQGPMELRYDPHWMASQAGRPLSLSLPFGVDDRPIKGSAVENYFDNLLPDSSTIRKRLAARFRAESDQAFDLLAAVGRDCVGVLQILPEGEEPLGYDRIEGDVLDDAQVEAHLLRAAGGDGRLRDEADDLRISLAGAQEKTALLHWGGQWLRPKGATPTTHILKLPLGLVGNRQADFHTSVDNEWLCLEILRAYGLPAPGASLLRFGQQRVLAVERFDRQPHSSGQWLLRLPQEDFCQVYGLPSHRKYEADGGPGVVELCSILKQSVQAEQDIANVLRVQILFWLLVAPDGHAKNFSLQILPRGRFRLTPFYDVMSAYPVLGKGPNQWSWHEVKLAMAVRSKNKHYAFRNVQRRHFNAMARLCGLDSAEPLIEDLLARTPGVIESVGGRLPDLFHEPVAAAILQGLKDAAERLARMPAQ